MGSYPHMRTSTRWWWHALFWQRKKGHCTWVLQLPEAQHSVSAFELASFSAWLFCRPMISTIWPYRKPFYSPGETQPQVLPFHIPVSPPGFFYFVSCCSWLCIRFIYCSLPGLLLISRYLSFLCTDIILQWSDKLFLLMSRLDLITFLCSVKTTGQHIHAAIS